MLKEMHSGNAASDNSLHATANTRIGDVVSTETDPDLFFFCSDQEEENDDDNKGGECPPLLEDSRDIDYEADVFSDAGSNDSDTELHMNGERVNNDSTIYSREESSNNHDEPDSDAESVT